MYSSPQNYSLFLNGLLIDVFVHLVFVGVICVMSWTWWIASICFLGITFAKGKGIPHWHWWIISCHVMSLCSFTNKYCNILRHFLFLKHESTINCVSVCLCVYVSVYICTCMMHASMTWHICIAFISSFRSSILACMHVGSTWPTPPSPHTWT